MNLQKTTGPTSILVVLLFTILLTACSNGYAVEAEPEASLPPTQVFTNIPENESPVEITPTVEVAQPTATTQPTSTNTPPAESQVSFNNEVFPIIESRCLNCHGGDRIEEGLDMTSYAGVMAGSVNGAVIIPGDAENSLFVELVATQKMPKRGAKLTPAMVQLFQDWVNQGALDN